MSENTGIERENWADMVDDTTPLSPREEPNHRQDRSQVDPHALTLAETFYERYKRAIHALHHRLDLMKLYDDTFDSWVPIASDGNGKMDKADFSKVLFAMAREMKIVKVADHGRKLLWKANMAVDNRRPPRDYDHQQQHRPVHREYEHRPVHREYDHHQRRPAEVYPRERRIDDRPPRGDYQRPVRQYEDRQPRYNNNGHRNNDMEEIKKNQDKMSELIRNQQKMIETLMSVSKVLNK